MAAAKKALAINPGKSPVSKAKTNTAKKPVSEAKPAAAAARRKRPVKRNTAASNIISTVFAAFIGASGIVGFDVVVNWLAPQLSATIRTIGKFSAAFLIGHYGRKMPVIGRYSDTISKTLYVFAAADVLANHLVPLIMPYLNKAKMAVLPPPPPQQLVRTETGELGALIQMPDGSQAVLIDETGYVDNSGQYGGDNEYVSAYAY